MTKKKFFNIKIVILYYVLQTNDEKIDGDALKALVTKFVGNEEERNKINKIVEECTEDGKHQHLNFTGLV